MSRPNTKNMSSLAFSPKEDLVLLYEQDRDMLGDGKFEAMWQGPYIVRRVLEKGDYELVDYDAIPLSEPRNGLYLKKYYFYNPKMHHTGLPGIRPTHASS